LARAAVAAGHVVAFGGQAGLLPTVEAAGFTGFDTGGASLFDTTERAPLAAPDPEEEARVVRDVYAGRIAHERADAVAALCEEWRPDVVVCDEMDFGAMVAAERLALPHATVLCIANGGFVPPGLVEEPLNGLRARHGLPPEPGLAMLRRDLVLTSFPPSLRDPAFPLPPNAHVIRPTASEQPVAEAAPTWLVSLHPSRTVYFTLGTIFNLESGDLFERVLAGLRELPLDILVTVGRELDPAVLGEQPANVRVERYVPQSLVLPRCSLVVSHAGSGSVVGALAHGLPLVLLPLGADQPLNAARCAELGVARVLDAVRVTPEGVREAVSTVLSEPAYRLHAARIRDEIAALPGPEHGLALLEGLAAERPPPPA
jgi:UDP:flavonoid glycosyltransferase YjiC (YdhE family)